MPGLCPLAEGPVGGAQAWRTHQALHLHDDYKGREFLDHETSSRVFSRDVLWPENAFRHKPWIPWPEQHPMPQPLPLAN
jgi:hypothetical protein